MDDHEIVRRIGEHTSEEHELERSNIGAGLSECDEHDPDDAGVRPSEVVEGYQQ